MPMPNMIKVENLAPVIPDAKFLHDMACAYVEEQFGRKGEITPTWIVAAQSSIAFIETEFDDPDLSKDRAVYVMRETVKRYDCQAYSFMSEVWSASFKSDEEHKQWTSHPDYEGVSSLPPHLRDDKVMIVSHARDGSRLMSTYLVTIRAPGRGLNFLGPRVDEDYKGMSGRMSSLFDPEVPLGKEKKK